MVKYTLKKYATDQGIAEYDAAIFHYMQPDKTTHQQYANDLVAKYCKVAHVYDKGTLKDVFVEGVDASIRHSLRHFWAQDPQAD